MGKYLKFGDAIGFLLAFLVCLKSLIHVVWIDINSFQLIQLGFGKAEGELEKYFVEALQREIRPLVFLILILMLLMWAGFFLSIILHGRTVYLSAVILAVMQAAMCILIYLGIGNKLDIVSDVLDFFGQSGMIKLYLSTLILWLAIYLFIIGLSVAGLLLCRRTHHFGLPSDDRSGDFYIPPMPPVSPTPVPPRIPPVSIPPCPVSSDPPVPAPPKPHVNQGFEGAIVGLGGKYTNMAYPLRDRRQVYFNWMGDEGSIAVREERMGVSCVNEENQGDHTVWYSGNVISLYYISEYNEYCMNILNVGRGWPTDSIPKVFLKSGQPLGRGRSYFLPRGTVFYVETEKNLFQLG